MQTSPNRNESNRPPRFTRPGGEWRNRLLKQIFRHAWIPIWLAASLPGWAADVGDGPLKMSGEDLKQILTGTNKQVSGRGIWMTNAVVRGQLDLRNATVESDVCLVGFVFHDAVLLNGCEFGKGLALPGCEFKGRFSAAELRVKRTLDFSSQDLFRETTLSTNGPDSNLFPGEETELAPPPTDPKLARRVRRSTNSIYWKGNKDDKFFLHRPTTFHEEADFDRADIGGNLSGDGVDFKKKGDFRGAKVGGTLWLENAVFRGEAKFAYVHVADQFSIREASFVGTNSVANFYQLACGGLADLSGASFKGPVNFIQATIQGNLLAFGAHFLHKKDLTKEQGMDFHHNADFGSLRVDGFAFFPGTEFAGDVSFRNARFTSVFFDGVSWPTNLARGNSVRLEWMRYDRIRASDSFDNSERDRTNLGWRRDHVETWKNLKPMLAGHAPYSTDVYASLEQFFQRDGNESLARDVYFEGKEQERKKILMQPLDGSAPSTARQKIRALAQVAGSFVFKIVVGHGRHPEWALVWSALIIAFGCRVFRLENMEPEGEAWKTPSPPARPRGWWGRLGERLGVLSRHKGYYALWYSLDAFVPLIELDSNHGWRPRPDNRLAWNYLIYHRVAGAILIPIGFAAFSGIIK